MIKVLLPYSTKEKLIKKAYKSNFKSYLTGLLNAIENNQADYYKDNFNMFCIYSNTKNYFIVKFLDFGFIPIGQFEEKEQLDLFLQNLKV